MGELRDRVVVLRHRPYRENDALVTCMGERFGKFSAVARGAHSPKSRLTAGVQAMALSQMVLYQGRSNLWTVSQSELERLYPRVRGDLERTARAAMLVDVVDELCSEHDAAPQSFRILTAALAALDDERPPTAVFLTGLWMLVREAGLMPDMMHCHDCGVGLDGVAYWRAGGGPVCGHCRHADDRELTGGALALLQKWSALALDRLGLVTGSGTLLAGLEQEAREHFLHHVGRVPRAFKFWDQVGPVMSGVSDAPPLSLRPVKPSPPAHREPRVKEGE